ncbi:MAG: hypothetical protein MJ178_07180 [Treponemataceae bacterium]|nr:hypothetical protein [Treponemataceae bacterium]
MRLKVTDHRFLLAISLFVCLLAVSCSRSDKSVLVPQNKDCIVLWTSDPSFSLYAELYNQENPQAPVIVVYKESPADSIPPAKDELSPDIIVGPWLKSSATKKYFLPLNYLFTNGSLNRADFYEPLIAAACIDERPYLMPVSFNMNAMLFKATDSGFIADNYVVTLDEIRESGTKFNKQNNSGIFTAMSYAPSWNSDFLYTVAALQGADFSMTNKKLSWDQGHLRKTVQFLQDWTCESNQSTALEQDFQFKYLYTPSIKWVNQEQVLFSYLTSDQLFATAEEKLEGLDFRWISHEGKTLVEDDIVWMGLYKNSKKLRKAEQFLKWFLHEETQKQLLSYINSLDFVTNEFGLAGGFSSLKSVNEYVLPVYYPQLLGNLPHEDSLMVYPSLPDHWESLKERVVIPYLEYNTDADRRRSDEIERLPPPTMQELLSEWEKQYFN